MTTRIGGSNLRYIKANEGDNHEISTIKIIMIREMIKIHIGQIVEIGEYHSVVEYNMDRTIETDQGIIKTIEVTLGEEICGPQIRIIEVDTEEIIEKIITKEVGVGPGIDNIQTITQVMVEVVVGLDQV